MDTPPSLTKLKTRINIQTITLRTSPSFTNNAYPSSPLSTYKRESTSNNNLKKNIPSKANKTLHSLVLNIHDRRGEREPITFPTPSMSSYCMYAEAACMPFFCQEEILRVQLGKVRKYAQNGKTNVSTPQMTLK